VWILRDHCRRFLIGKAKLSLITREQNAIRLSMAGGVEDPGTGKPVRKVMKGQLPASSTIHTPLLVQGSAGVLLNFFASIKPQFVFKCPVRNALRIWQQLIITAQFHLDFLFVSFLYQ
jgi:hypothetical protein